MKRMFLLIVVLSLLCVKGINLGAVEKSNFLDEYENLLADAEQKIAEVKSKYDYEKLMTKRNTDLEALLEKHASDPDSDQVELLQARILIDLKKYREAESKLNALINKNSSHQDEARLFLAKILAKTEKIGEATSVFKQAEAKLPHTSDFFEVAIALAFEAPEDKVRQEYCRMLLAASDLPKKFSQYRVYMVTTLVEIELKKRNIAEAKGILQEALKTFTDEKEANSLQSALKHLEFIDKPAPAIAAENWLNSVPLTLGELKGRVVIIDFWAPWCGPCRRVIPTLAHDYNDLKDQGLVVIGFTKLYGRYSDEIQNKGAVDAENEKKLIQGFVERNKLKYPIAISDQGAEFEKYGVNGIPTMVFIGRDGNIYDIKVGSGDEVAITDKIKKLLAEK